MLHSLHILFVCIIFPILISTEGDSDVSDLGESLIPTLNTDRNLDLSADEEYEDLRSELLAYHTALSSLSDQRRSLKITPCANIGGICINYKLCPGYQQLTEVPGCKSNYQVCCFVSNVFDVRDQKEHGLGNIAFPWKMKETEFGGKGVQVKKLPRKKKKRKHTLVARRNPIAILLSKY